MRIIQRKKKELLSQGLREYMGSLEDASCSKKMDDREKRAQRSQQHQMRGLILHAEDFWLYLETVGATEGL